MSTRRLALLRCDEVLPHIKAAHGGLEDYFHGLLTSSLARVTPHHADVTFTLDTFDVVNLVYPDDDARYDGILISGSRASAYEDVEWINTLVAYVERILRSERSSLKLFGICFGHQIIARALGGQCVPNGGRWEVSVTTMQLTPIGKAIFGSDELDLQQMHRDHVPTPPPSGTHILGRTDVTPNHGMVVFNDPPTGELDTVVLTSVRVLTLQGHPEYTAPVMSALLDSRVSILGRDLVDDGHRRQGGVPSRYHPDGLACDGVGKVGRVIWGILGIAS